MTAKSILIVGNAPGALVSDPSKFDMVLGFNSLNGFEWLGKVITHHMMRMSAACGCKYGGEHLALQHKAQLMFADRVECRHVQELEAQWRAAGKTATNFRVRWPGLKYTPGKTPSTGYSVIQWYVSKGYAVTVERFTFKGVKIHDWAFEEKAARDLAASGAITLVCEKPDEAAKPSETPAKAVRPATPAEVPPGRLVAFIGMAGDAGDLACRLAAAGCRVSVAVAQGDARQSLPSSLAAHGVRICDSVADAARTASVAVLSGDSESVQALASEVGAVAAHNVALLLTGHRRAGSCARALEPLRAALSARFPMAPADELGAPACLRIDRGSSRVVVGSLSPEVPGRGASRAAAAACSIGLQAHPGATAVTVPAADAEAAELVLEARREMLEWLDRSAVTAAVAGGKATADGLSRALGMPVPAAPVAEAFGAGPSALSKLLGPQ